MGKYIKNKKIFLLLTVLLLLAFAIPAWAVDCFKISTQPPCETEVKCDWDTVSAKCCDRLGIDWPNSPLGTSIARCTNVTGMVKYLYEWGIALGGLVTFIALIIGGFQYLTSMGEPAKITEAKDRIQSAFLGLILLLSSWLILTTINPQLTTFKAELELVEITPEKLELPRTELKPCEFVHLYENTRWTGDLKEIRPRADEERISPLRQVLSYVIYREREITSVECDPAKPPKDTICVRNPKDGKYYLLEPCDPETEHCLSKEGKFYKAGGACILEFYYQTTWWIFPTGGCGDKMISVGAPAIDDLSLHLQNPAQIRCVRLTQIITKK